MTEEERKAVAIRTARLMGAKAGMDGWVHIKGAWPGEDFGPFVEKCKVVLYAAGCTHVSSEVSKKDSLEISSSWNIDIHAFDVSGFNPSWPNECPDFPFHPPVYGLIRRP